jgi:hypothetical protein
LFVGALACVVSLSGAGTLGGKSAAHQYAKLRSRLAERLPSNNSRSQSQSQSLDDHANSNNTAGTPAPAGASFARDAKVTVKDTFLGYYYQNSQDENKP